MLIPTYNRFDKSGIYLYRAVAEAPRSALSGVLIYDDEVEKVISLQNKSRLSLSVVLKLPYLQQIRYHDLQQSMV